MMYILEATHPEHQRWHSDEDGWIRVRAMATRYDTKEEAETVLTRAKMFLPGGAEAEVVKV